MNIKGRWKNCRLWEKFFIVAFLLGGIGFLLLSPEALSNAVKTYEGKALFPTEEEYSRFKELLASPEVDIQELEVLSSEVSLVLFIVEVPPTIDFPYGTLVTPIINGMGIYFLFAGIVLTGVSVLIFFVED